MKKMEGFRANSPIEKENENISREEHLRSAEKSVGKDFESIGEKAIEKIEDDPYFTELQ